MSKSITNPLQSVIKRAGQTLPAQTGKTATQQAKIERRRGSNVILADVSASMSSIISGGKRKVDLLREAIQATQGSARLFAFSAGAREVTAIPEPESNTNLALGLKAVQVLDPGTTLVISDGEPDNERAALEVARSFRGVIDVLYIGPASNTRAIDFMMRLANAAGGKLVVNDVAREKEARLLEHHIIKLLPGPR